MKKIFLSVVSLLAAVSLCFGGAGTKSAQFLKLASGGRSSALGNAFTGVTDDASSVFYNPSGIAFSEKKHVSLMYSTYLEEISYQNVAFSMPLGAKLGIGLGVTMLSYGVIKGYDDQMVATKDVAASDMAVNISGGYKVTETIGAGFTLKYISETLDDKTGSTPSADVGFIFKKDKLSAGLSAQNLFGSLKFITTAETIPMIIRLGAGFQASDKLLVLADFNSMDAGIGVGVGAEFVPIELLAIRVGYNYNSAVTGIGLTGITAGIGLNIKQFGIDVSYAPYGDLGNSIKAALSAKF